MRILTNEEKKIALDIRSGSFIIYNTESLKSLSYGTLESFRNNHENMRKWAIQKFDGLCK